MLIIAQKQTEYVLQARTDLIVICRGDFAPKSLQKNKQENELNLLD